VGAALQEAGVAEMSDSMYAHCKTCSELAVDRCWGGHVKDGVCSLNGYWPQGEPRPADIRRAEKQKKDAEYELLILAAERATTVAVALETAYSQNTGGTREANVMWNEYMKARDQESLAWKELHYAARERAREMKVL
jgi:hypothetical protein